MKKAEHIGPLGDKVRATLFKDAKHSGNDSCLLGPPSAEFAPFQKTSSARTRKDARQSTIDQDPEFIDFLESLTTPITKSSTVDQDSEAARNKDKITVTPLIQYLKEKKANKGKEAPNSAKSNKHGRQDSKGSKSGINASSKTAPVVVSPATKKRSAQAVKVEQAARDAVKVLTKQTTNTRSSTSSGSSTPNAKVSSSGVASNITPNSTATAVLADKKRERGNASAAAKILQRDLGLAGTPGSRSGRGARGSRSGNATTPAPTQQQAVAKSEQPKAQAASPSKEKVNENTASAAEPAEPKGALPVTGVPSTPMAASTTSASKSKSPPSGPAASRANPPTHPRSAHSSTSHTSTTTSTKATQAFLKHANPSQGITEALLSDSFAPFGDIKKCEIDKKKGFAYIDFESPDGLQKAINASPVKVAQGQVVVLERKIGGREQPGRSGGSGGGGGVGRSGGSMGGNRGGAGGAGGVSIMARGGNAGARGGGATRVRGGGANRGGAAKVPTVLKAATTSPSVNTSPSATASPTESAKAAVENTGPLLQNTLPMTEP